VKPPFDFLFRLVLFILVGVLCFWAAGQQFSATLDLIIIVGGILLVFPVVWIGRKILEKHPNTQIAAWTTTGVHLFLLLLLGMAIIEAVKTYPGWYGWKLPIPTGICLGLAIITGTIAVLSVLNLALKGLGAPFALALTQKLSIDWLYAWTRNPMVFSTLLFFVALGIWLQSALFVVWVLGLVTPAWLAFVKVYEEKELEIRFGKSYLEYKAKTPLLFPRRPRQSS
jgi:protein-S-isoprenylcysteine O-methyltransferase Ste14